MRPGYTCPQWPDPIRYEPTTPASYDQLFKFPTRTAQNLQQIAQPGSVSCRPRIPLQRDYSNLVLNASDANRLNQMFVPTDPTSNTQLALVRAIYELNETAGSTQDDIISLAVTIAPNFTETQLNSTFSLSRKRGLFTNIVPNSWNPVFEQPTVKWSFGPKADFDVRNKTAIAYLIELVGGIGSNEYTQWFDYYRKKTCQSPFFPNAN